MTRVFAIDPMQLFSFIGATQAEQWEQARPSSTEKSEDPLQVPEPAATRTQPARVARRFASEA